MIRLLLPILFLLPNISVAGKIVNLTTKNTLSLRGPVTSESVAKLSEKLLKLSKKLDKNATIYLTLDTPGGSVIDGVNFIDTANSIPQKVKTITIFAASMGFQIAQHMDDRLITPGGILMSHRASLGIRGELYGELDSQLSFIRKIVDRLDKKTSARLNMTRSTYAKKIADEYWLDGKGAVMTNAADHLVRIRCSKKMLKRYTETAQSIFGTIKVTYSKCPIITAPLKLELEDLDTHNANYDEFYQMLGMMYYNKHQFLKQYIINSEGYSKYSKWMMIGR